MIDVFLGWAFPVIPLVDMAKDQELRKREADAEHAADEALIGMKKARMSFDKRPSKESGGIEQLRAGLSKSDSGMRKVLSGE